MIENSCRFVRMKDEVKTVPLNEQVDEDPEKKVLFSLIKENEGYYIDTEKNGNADKLWLVVRAMKNEVQKLSYELKKGDIVKLGRIQFRVKDIQTEGIPKNNPKDITLNEDIEEVGSVITAVDDKQDAGDSSTAAQCRFCWENE